jgi:hypothetical protein
LLALLPCPLLAAVPGDDAPGLAELPALMPVPALGAFDCAAVPCGCPPAVRVDAGALEADAVLSAGGRCP